MARTPRSVVVAALLGALGCGGGSKPTDTYTAATSKQEACCEHLGGPDRATCLGEVQRIDDPDVATVDLNRATYACVQQHFVCDEASGRATAASAQAQYDCIQDLPAE